MSTIPPGGRFDRASYAQVMAYAFGAQAVSSDPKVIPGMHRTDTVDVVTIVAGELHAVLEADETVLRAGDTIVQRGTMHAWQNRSQHPVTLVSVMMDAPRSHRDAGDQIPS
ncbi:cupin domain-containing protein [Mycolicibacterium madagascariense]|nr:cupin domain-containing protein [Mycolicibacterium madagascariense]